MLSTSRCQRALMPDAHKPLTLVLKNDLGEIDSIWATLERVLEEYHLSRKDMFQINLAVEELFTNIVSYAFEDKGPHDIFVNIYVERRKFLVVELMDDGIPFNPADHQDPDMSKPLSQRDEGGLGIHFCKKMMAEFFYERNGKQNKVTFKKRIRKPGFFEKFFSCRRSHGN